MEISWRRRRPRRRQRLCASWCSKRWQRPLLCCRRKAASAVPRRGASACGSSASFRRTQTGEQRRSVRRRRRLRRRRRRWQRWQQRQPGRPNEQVDASPLQPSNWSTRQPATAAVDTPLDLNRRRRRRHVAVGQHIAPLGVWRRRVAVRRAKESKSRRLFTMIEVALFFVRLQTRACRTFFSVCVRRFERFLARASGSGDSSDDGGGVFAPSASKLASYQRRSR